MSLFRRKDQIASRDTSSSSSLALSSSNTPAQVAGSPDKGKLSKLFRRGKRGHTDTTGDVAVTSPDSEGPVLQSNKSTTTTSQPLANAQTTTTSDSADKNNLADTSSGNKTANAAVILDIVQAACEVLDNVPYVKVVTGVLSTLIKTINVRCHFTVSPLC